MTAAYLWINAVLYAVFGVMCALNPRGTAKALGYSLSTHGGLSEYLTVYGGLQFGLAAFFAWVAMRDDLHPAGLVLALALYTPIVLFRWGQHRAPVAGGADDAGGGNTRSGLAGQRVAALVEELALDAWLHGSHAVLIDGSDSVAPGPAAVQVMPLVCFGGLDCAA